MSAPHASLLMVPAAAATGSTWSPTDKQTNVILSSGDLVATCNNAASGSNVRGTQSRGSTGKYYFEIYMTEVNGNNPTCGIVKTSVSINGAWGFGAANMWIEQATPGYAFGDTAYKGTGGVAWGDGDTMCFAVDFAAGKIWYGKNGTWILSGNPAAGTNATWATVNGTCAPCAKLGTVTSPATAARLRTIASQFGYSVPSGFNEWG